VQLGLMESRERPVRRVRRVIKDPQASLVQLDQLAPKGSRALRVSQAQLDPMEQPVLLGLQVRRAIRVPPVSPGLLDLTEPPDRPAPRGSKGHRASLVQQARQDLKATKDLPG